MAAGRAVQKMCFPLRSGSLNSLCRDEDTSTSSRLLRAMVPAILTLALTGVVSSGHAQRADEIGGAEENPQPEMSRQEWLNTVNEATRRAKQIAIERRLHPELYKLPPEDPDAIATERALNDESLEPGDIVATKHGFLVFRGKSGEGRRQDEFAPAPAPGKLR